MSRLPCFLIVGTAIVLSFQSSASAALIYSNITGDVIPPGGSFYDVFLPEAWSFVPSAGQNYALQEIDISLLALTYLNPSAGHMAVISIFADSSGLPGSLLESFSVSVPSSDVNTLPHFITKVQSIFHPVLTGGKTYWVGASPALNSVTDFWLINDTNDVSLTATQPSPNGPWIIPNPFSDPTPPKSPKGAFRVLGTPTGSATFVTQQYLDLLGRSPDPAGLQYWTGELNASAISRAQLAYQFLTSGEFQQVGQLVVSAYIAVLGRDPDINGWQFWVNSVHQGLPALSMVDAFVTSPEFQSTYGSLDNSAFVNRVYLNVLGRLPDPAGFNFWLGELNAGTITRAQLMYSFVISAEFQASIQNRSLAILMYMGFLRRSPDPIGEAYWIGSLNQGTTPVQVENSFITSPEYLGRFSADSM